MTFHFKRIVAAAALAALGAVPALAGSLATSSAVGGSSASSASSATSDSLGTSSNSSKKAVAQANGPYRLVDVTPVPERPGTVRITLQPLAEADDARDVLRLEVPRPALERSGLAPGRTVNARPRPYGVEFASADTGRAFFLVVDDAWHRELGSHPVKL